MVSQSIACGEITVSCYGVTPDEVCNTFNISIILAIDQGLDVFLLTLHDLDGLHLYQGGTITSEEVRKEARHGGSTVSWVDFRTGQSYRS